MKKKKTALMMAAVMTVSLLAACGQKTSAPAAESTAQPDAAQTTEASKEASQEESQAPAESTGEVTELKVFGFKTGAEEGAIPTLIEQFNKENPDIHVVYEGISNAGGYQDVLTARLASGQGDDVFFANPNYLPQMQEAGYVEDLTDMPVVANYSGLVKDLLTINDSIPGLGMEIAVFGMFSNMDVLNEVGIEKAPENYKEFLEDCQILKDAGKTPIVAGAKDGTAMAIFSIAKSLDPVYQAPDKMEQISAMLGTQAERGIPLSRNAPSAAICAVFPHPAFRKTMKELLRIGHMKFSHHYLVFLLSIIFRIRASISVTTLLYSHATFSLCPIS